MGEVVETAEPVDVTELIDPRPCAAEGATNDRARAREREGGHEREGRIRERRRM